MIIGNLENSRPMTDLEIYALEIADFKASEKRKKMIEGINYEKGKHAILGKKRTAVGDSGLPVEVANLPNNKIVDNQYLKVLTQKVNYILGKPLTIDSEDEKYKEILSQVFDKGFNRTLKGLCKDAMNCGIGWLYIHRTNEGDISFKRLDPTEVVPLWKDSDHTELDVLLRVYKVTTYEGKKRKEIEKVEVYNKHSLVRYLLENGNLIPDVENPGGAYYIESNEYGEESMYSWKAIPVIAFKYNDNEQPLIARVKCLQDGLNCLLSTYMDNTQEDAGNTILILENYDGENLGEFRRNLSTYRTIKVRSYDGIKGDVRALHIEVNPENYKTILSLLKKAIIENAMSYDAKDDRLAGNPNQMNIQSMYSDIDLDSNTLETEFQASLDMVLDFVDEYLKVTGQGDYIKTQADFIFTRDVLMNQTEAIQNVIASSSVLSRETVISKHPWVTDVGQELERLKEQEESSYADFKLIEKDSGDEKQ